MRTPRDGVTGEIAAPGWGENPDGLAPCERPGKEALDRFRPYTDA